MTLADFVRLGLCSPLPARSQPEAVRLAMEQTSRLPLDLVTWVATAPAEELKVQFSQAVMVRFGSKSRAEEAQAGQLALLIKKRLLQLGFTFYRGGFYLFGPKPAVQQQQLRLFQLLARSCGMNYTYGYARVSADDQNLATQIDTLERDGVDKLYQEKVTGTRTSSPALYALLKVLRPGDTVKVAMVFRLGRNSAHLISLIAQFEQEQIRFVALDLGVDSSTPAGKLIITIFAGLAQQRREELLEKTAHGRALAKAAGIHMGRPPGVDPKQLAKVKKWRRKCHSRTSWPRQASAWPPSNATARS